MKIRPVGQRSMRTDKRIDRHDETNGHFCNSANVAKI